MMEELVEQLVRLQAEQKAEEAARDSDGTMIELRAAVADAKGSLEMAEKALADDLAYYDPGIAGIVRDIETIKAQIVEVWDGEKKTMQYPAGILKFRTSQSLEIRDRVPLMYDLAEHMSLAVIASDYISGFNKTTVKKYMTVHSVSPETAILVPKTTVKLDVI